MKTAVFSTKPYDQRFLEAEAAGKHDFTFYENRLRAETKRLCEGHEAACLFVHDTADAEVIEYAAQAGCKLLALRCAGFNNVDLAAARQCGVTVARVPAYSPHGVAEFAAGLLMTLNRKFHRAYSRVRDHNFSLDGLLGFDIRGKTVGVIGTGKIGAAFCKIMLGFGCRVVAFDVYPQDNLQRAGVEYHPLDDLWPCADIISLHCPLTEQTADLIRAETIALMKPGVMVINTSRGGLVDTPALIDGLRSGKIGSVGLDVYEEEAGVFFEDFSNRVLPDDTLTLLLGYPNVLLTSHQGFFTEEALTEIAHATVCNLDEFAAGQKPANAVEAQA